jgi:hypothetical protein
MREEISEEAKRAIADAPRRRAAHRLAQDGAHSLDAIRRRVRAIAHDRNLQPADIAKLMHKRIITAHAMAFCEKHKISMDWLLCGDLKGLQRMTKEAKAEPAPDDGPYRDLLAAFGKLDRAGRKAIVNYLSTQVDVEPDPQDEGGAA